MSCRSSQAARSNSICLEVAAIQYVDNMDAVLTTLKSFEENEDALTPSTTLSERRRIAPEADHKVREVAVFDDCHRKG